MEEDLCCELFRTVIPTFAEGRPLQMAHACSIFVQQLHYNSLEIALVEGCDFFVNYPSMRCVDVADFYDVIILEIVLCIITPFTKVTMFFNFRYWYEFLS